MNLRALGALLLLAAAMVVSDPASAARKLYGATAQDDKAGGEGMGDLYVINPASAVSKRIGTIMIDGVRPCAVDGLAVHPKTGVLYGITSRNSKHPSLVVIDPRTATAKKIGPLGVRGTDISFDAEGNLFVWILDSHRMGRVDLATGNVTPFGLQMADPGKGGGLAIDPRGRAIVAAGPQKGVMEEVDPKTGESVGGLALLDASLLNAINALSFSPTGVLFAVSTARIGVAGRDLVSIDTETGDITNIGSLPDGIDAIAFDDGPPNVKNKMGLLFVMVAVLILLHIAGILRWRKPR